jgi:PhnB protein
MTTVNVYLTFDGKCEEAFDFYKSVFGGEFPYVGRYKDMPRSEGGTLPLEEAEKIMHIALPISSETVLMGCDSSLAFGPPASIGNNISLSISTDNEKEAIRLFYELSSDGKILMPLDKTFWGALFGMFKDKFGINWMVNYEYKKSE